jgi:hypothetical protein
LPLPISTNARRMADAEALALDDVFARGRDVEEEVDEVVLEQVDLVDVEEAAIGAGEQAGLERASRPRREAFSRSSAPTTRSSVAPSGRSTTGTGAVPVLRRPPARRVRHSSQSMPGAPGSQP